MLDSRFGAEQAHLQALGTHPSYLRRGLARRLCRWGMDQAARDGVVVTLLASPMGRGVYPRLGFDELGTITAQVDGGGGRDNAFVCNGLGSEDARVGMSSMG